MSAMLTAFQPGLNTVFPVIVIPFRISTDKDVGMQAHTFKNTMKAPADYTSSRLTLKV
jgi:hypothetical protein